MGTGGLRDKAWRRSTLRALMESSDPYFSPSKNRELFSPCLSPSFATCFTHKLYVNIFSCRFRFSLCPEQSLSRAWASWACPESSDDTSGPILAPCAPRLQFPSRVCQGIRFAPLQGCQNRFGIPMGLPHMIHVQRTQQYRREAYCKNFSYLEIHFLWYRKW